ncbi:MAG: ribosome-binding factor A [Methylacidiphilales bacterium]|nr:ribosome-binding factor A [Candidatus Methylacidiphilales bacterium]
MRNTTSFKPFPRSLRISKEIVRLLPNAIRSIIPNKIPFLITFTNCVVSSDCSHAKVYFVQHDNTTEHTIALLTLNAKKFRMYFRSKLNIKKIPNFTFIHDTAFPVSKN